MPGAAAAVPAQHTGMVQALEQGARGLLYAEMLGEISKLRPVLAVAGSHGKSTTTAWMAWALREAGVEVGFLVGAGIPQLGRSADWGDPALPLLIDVGSNIGLYALAAAIGSLSGGGAGAAEGACGRIGVARGCG